MLMMLISIGIAIRHLICSNNLNWILNLNVICKTLDWGKMWPVDFSAGKSKLVLFDQSNNNGSNDVEMDGSVIEENHLLRCCSRSSLLNWIVALIVSLLIKLTPRKLKL